MATGNQVDSQKIVSLKGFIQPTNLHFVLYDVWNGQNTDLTQSPYGTYVFLKDASDAVHELMDSLSMWGGVVKRHPDDPEAKAWELDGRSLQAFKVIAERTKSRRPADAKEGLL